ESSSPCSVGFLCFSVGIRHLSVGLHHFFGLRHHFLVGLHHFLVHSVGSLSLQIFSRFFTSSLSRLSFHQFLVGSSGKFFSSFSSFLVVSSSKFFSGSYSSFFG
ncbi:14309_t:CDS:2, partial [Dentiscutata erythropus]